MASNILRAVRSRDIERRRPEPDDELPIETLRQMPALVVLDRLPTPALAVDGGGDILFANGAFCDLVGYSSEELRAMKFQDIFQDLGALARTEVKRPVELRHKDGHTVWAIMSKSVTQRRDDTVELATFQDRTEDLWVNRVAPQTGTSRR